jgi:hypothetical protein
MWVDAMKKKIGEKLENDGDLLIDPVHRVRTVELYVRKATQIKKVCGMF